MAKGGVILLGFEEKGGGRHTNRDPKSSREKW